MLFMTSAQISYIENRMRVCCVTVKWPAVIGYLVVSLLLVVGLGITLHVKWLEVTLIYRSHCWRAKHKGQSNFIHTGMHTHTTYISEANVARHIQCTGALSSATYWICYQCVLNSRWLNPKTEKHVAYGSPITATLNRMWFNLGFVSNPTQHNIRALIKRNISLICMKTSPCALNVGYIW